MAEKAGGGVVVVRHGANPLEVIEAVREKIAEIARGHSALGILRALRGLDDDEK